MTSTYPALHSRFGSTEYFLVSMPVGALIRHITFPEDLPEWDNKSIEEKYQRNLNMSRVVKEIAPYFAEDENRFSGSLVMAMMNHEHVVFEEIGNLADGVPKMYDARDMGFLTLSGEEVFVPLDGQHRAKAFEMAIRGRSDPPRIRPNPDLAKDYVAVILVYFDKDRSRYIFNKINRYAKPTGQADKLITDDDDAVAVITREIISSGVISQRLVYTRSNSLNRKAPEFTTLGTLYNANIALLSGSKVPCAADPKKMAYSERQKRSDDLKEEWKRLLSGIRCWKSATADPSERGDRGRIKLRKTSLTGRPVGQLSLIQGYAFACQRNRNVDRDVLIGKLDKINWNASNKMWENILVRPNGRIMFGKTVINNASMVIARMIGVNLSRGEMKELRSSIYGRRRGKSLPEPVR